MIRYMKKIVIRVFGIITVIWLFVELLVYFKLEPFKDNLIGFVLLILLISVSFEFALYIRRNSKVTITIVEALINELDKLLKEEEYATILRRRNNFSRSLWVEGKPIERLKLGKIAEEAANNIKDKQAHASILIDDLGWTSVTLEKYEDANNYIKHGLKKAEELNDFYLIAKAHRHLAGIFLEARDYEGALEEMRNAQLAAEKIKENSLRNEMLGGIYYGLSMISLRMNEPNEADIYIKKSEEYRLLVGDDSRVVKIHSQKGRIEEALDNYSSAKDHFRIGLNEAKTLGRTDEIIRNMLGLSRILKKENNEQVSNEYLDEAKLLLKNTPIPYRINDKNLSLNKLRNYRKRS